jgi:L-aspartate oxidase
MVYGRRAAEHTLRHATTALAREAVTAPEATWDSTPLNSAQIALLRTQIQKQMQHNVGIVRTTSELECARRQVEEALIQLSTPIPSTVEAWEARNIAQIGLLIVESALMRHESRGLHSILDYPETLESERHDTVLVP